MAVFASFNYSLFAQDLPNSSPSHEIQPYSVEDDSLIIDQININGNKKTIDKIIYRELDFRVGDKLPKVGIDSLLLIERNKVFNTNLFTLTDISYVPVEGKLNTIVVNIDLQERWFIWPVPIFELSDRNVREWLNRGADLSRVNYGAFFKNKNFRGRNETLNLRVQGGFTRRIALIYNIPFIDRKQKTNLAFNINYSENKRTGFITSNHKFVEVNGGDEVMRRRFFAQVRAGKRYGFYNFHTISFRYNNNWVNDTIAHLNPSYFLEGRNRLQFFQFTYTFKHDKRDFAGYPLQGDYLELSFDKTGLGFIGDLDITTLEGTAGKFMDLDHNFFWSSIASGRVSYPAIQPYTQMTALGYRGNLIRGYEDFVVEGQHFGIVKNTLRFKAAEGLIDFSKFIPVAQFNKAPYAIYPKVYFDFGHVQNNIVTFDNTRLSNKFLWGTGFGLDFVTFYNAVFRLEYSVNQFNKSIFSFSYNAEL